MKKLIMVSFSSLVIVCMCWPLNEVQAQWSSNSTEVYLNTSNESKKVHIGGNTNSSVSCKLIVDAGSGDVFRARVGLNSSANTKLRVASNGGTSIGTSSTPPANGLHVNGNVNIGSFSTSAKFLVDANSGDVFRARVSGNTKLKVHNNGGTTLGINGTPPSDGLRVVGNVRIGSANVPAGFKMSVDGKIIAEEIEVRLSQDWPDYVFDEKYDLMPLDELGENLQENKHLPGVPSAAEVEENGIGMGELQTILLHKVEELTLYVLMLKEENEVLQQRIECLE